MNRIEDILVDHVKITRYLCNSVALGPMLIDHGTGRGPTELVLQCSKDVDANGRHADGDRRHKDMIHCYTFHQFDPEMATQTNSVNPPRDRSTCSKCRTSWPCDAVKVAEMCDSELVAW